MFFVRILFQTVGLALGQILAHKGKAVLTALGIIIGVGSVTAVIAALTGMQKFVLGEFETVGANYVWMDGTVPPSMQDKIDWLSIQLQEDEIAAIEEHAQSIARITPIWRCNLEVRYGVEEIQVSAQGIRPSWHEIEKRFVTNGRTFTNLDVEGNLPVCLINDKGIEELELDQNPVGDFLYLSGRRFMIVGVVETKALSPMFGGGTPRTEIFLPFTMAQKLNPRGWINDARAELVDPSLADDAKAEIRFILRSMRGLKPDEEDTFIVETVQSFIDGFKRVAGATTAIAAGVVSVSLLVGGVGIMNIMLVSVSERTREIGLRKSVGAQPAVVLMQFLVEAVVLCAVGGLIGLLLGQALTFTVKNLPGAQLEHAEIPPWAIALAIGFSAAVGVIFGMFPALKAAKLNPIEALRHE